MRDDEARLAKGRLFHARRAVTGNAQSLLLLLLQTLIFRVALSR